MYSDVRETHHSRLSLSIASQPVHSSSCFWKTRIQGKLQRPVSGCRAHCHQTECDTLTKSHVKSCSSPPHQSAPSFCSHQVWIVLEGNSTEATNLVFVLLGYCCAQLVLATEPFIRYSLEVVKNKLFKACVYFW